ncbi:MAG: hypothetical protein NTW97_07710 [Candidatus Krumholzibacteria bacterium]|nr:hypothetical protein [Candidatus Krumholzibacteria bacterium]
MDTSEPTNTAASGSKANDDFRVALTRLLAAGRSASARGAFAMLLCAGLGAFAALLAAESPLRGWRFFPLFSFVLFWGAVAAAACAAAVRQFYPARGDRWLAGELDRRLGGGNLVEAALEFSKGGERVHAYSSFLVAATVSRARERLRGLDPREIFAAAGRPAWTAAGIILSLLVALDIAAFGANPVGIVASIADPGQSFRFPYRYNLIVTSGNRSVLPGESVTVEAINYGSMRGDATLLTSTIPGVWNRIDVRGAEVPGEGAKWYAYRHEFADVREEFVYAFSAGGVRTAEHRVTVIHRPVINGMTAVLKYPAYTGAKADTLEPLAGRIVALAGTRVEIEGRTSKPIRDGRLRFASGGTTQLAPGPGGFTALFTIAANDTFVVETVDSLGFTNDHAVKYPVAALDDAPPSIEIVAPDDGAELPRTLIADLYYRGSDDYGIARVRLFSMRDGKDENFAATQVPIPAGPVTEIEGRFAWSLENAGVFPGDKILYYLEITDNNTATGPRSARTATRRILVPSISEIYARIREDESRRRDDLEDVLDKGREIRERMKKLSNEIKAEGDLDWSRRRESGEILEKQREIQSKMQDITGEIDKSLETLEKNRAASQDVGRKVEEIQRLLKSIENDNLRSAIEKLQKLMNEVPTGELAARMNEIELDTDKLIENMDRTIELLKQVIKEEKMDELVRRMEEMLKEQTAIRDSTAKRETKDLADRQEKLGEEAEDYEKKLGEFTGEESDSSLAAELDSILKEMERSKPGENMKRAAEQMSREDREGAQCSQKEAIDDMLSLFTSLASCQMSMGLTMEKEVAANIARSTRELVEASKLQESAVPPGLRGQGGRSSAQDPIQDELVVKTALQKISQNLYQVARKTMVLSPNVFMRLGLAQKEIDLALGAMEEGRSLEASEASARAYRAMNLAAIELLRTSVSQGGSGGSGRERMQQLLKQQLSLKQELQRLLERGQSGQWSMEERAGMARLAAEQRKMEEVMKQIAEESRGARDALGKLDDIAGSMEEVARDLDEGKLDDEVLDRQERILTRMLDSQRSLRERDYKKERSSTVAGDVRALAPERWREEVGDEEILLRMIQRAMQEKGPREYEELIREYFRALSEKVREPK